MAWWQLWGKFFDSLLLVLLQKATYEANDNIIDHLSGYSVDSNYSQLPLFPKSVHYRVIFAAEVAHERGKFRNL